MKQLHICAFFMLPSGRTELLCATATTLSCTRGDDELCCTVIALEETTIHTKVDRTLTLQGKLSHSLVLWMHAQTFLPSLV